MDSQQQSLPTLAVEATTKLIQILGPLSFEDRERAINAAKILLGHTSPDSTTPNTTQPPSDHSTVTHGLSLKADGWMKKHGVTMEMLEQVFAFDLDHSEIDVIAAKMPGTSKRQQTVESYVICGLRPFLLTGETAFGDKDAREVCIKTGCYDGPNHSNYMRALDNLVHGSKETGWRLSNPGLGRAAEIVRQLTSTQA